MHGTNLSSNLALISRRALFFKPGSRKASLLMTDFSKLMSTEYLQRNKQTTNQKHFLDCVPQEKSSTHLVIMLLAAMKQCRPIMDLIWRSTRQMAVSTSCDVQLLGFVWSKHLRHWEELCSTSRDQNIENYQNKISSAATTVNKK